MSSPFPIDFSLDLLPSGQTPTIAFCDSATGCSDKLFKDILADENLLSDIMDKLKQLLPEDVYAQIEEMVQSGNGLPLAAIFSPESPLFNQDLAALPQATQDALKLDGDKIPTIMASTLKSVDEQLQKMGDEPAGRAWDKLGSQISEALSQASTKGGDSAVGKQIQDLLTAVKAELATSDAGVKNFLPTSSGAEASVTPATAISTAISGLAQLSGFATSGGSPMPSAIAAPLGDEAAWGQAMGDRIMWMMGKGIQAASIRINPPELGPIQVQLSVNNDQASVHMLVQHGAVKEALDAAIPRLRDMLGDSNLNLVNVDISQQESTDQSSGSTLFSQNQREQMEHFLQEQELASSMEEEAPRYYRSSGLLDDYA